MRPQGAGHGFWQELRADYGINLRQELAAAWRETVATTRAIAAMIRDDRRVTRQGHQLITGLASPTRGEVRKASREIGTELDELKNIEQRVFAEHEHEQERRSES